MPLNYKFSLVSTVTFRSFTICSDMPKFHQEICKIKDIFIKNDYSERFLDKCVKTFLNKVFIPKRIIQTAEKKQVTIVLPYMGMISTELKVKLRKTFKQLLPACELRVIFKVSLSENCVFNYYIILSVTATMLNTSIKPNDIMERESRIVLVSHHSQGNVLKITLKFQPYMITCFLVRQLVVLKIFQFLLKVHSISNLRFRKVF